MDTIKHKTVKVNGINIHVAEKGEGPVVLFLHGFPELWYTWRHQILAFADKGYHAVAPDLRGFGDSDAPTEVSDYNCHHVVGDIVALINTLGVDKIYLVAHDWGAMIAWYLCLFRPDLIKAFVTLTVPYRPREAHEKPVQGMRNGLGDDYYMCRFQDRDIEDEIKSYGTANYLKKVLANRMPGAPRLPKSNPFGALSSIPLIVMPDWFSEEDLNYYASRYENKGFSGPLSYYRTLDLSWELTAPWTAAKVHVPVKFVVGDLDVVYTTAGTKEYVHGGEFKKNVPLLEDIVVMEGVAHFINQERPEEVNSHIHDFIKKF